jgi:GT2 family glycosyltransferase
VHTRTPLVVNIDVEPDDRLVQPSVRPRWTGFETLLPELRRIRSQLAQATGAPVKFSWLFRIDHQVERVYGQPDWGLNEYRRQIEELVAQGDVIGAHAHSWRWDEVGATWIADHADPHWVEHCVRLSLDGFRQATGKRARIFSHGDEFLSDAVVHLIDSMGVYCDLTITPGNPARERMGAGERVTGSLPDYRDLPRVPYQPSRDNYRQPSVRRQRRLWLMPVTTGFAVNPYAASPAPYNQKLLLGAPFVVNQQIFDNYWARFPLSVIVAATRSDVFLDSFNADQFRRFFDYLADHPCREQLLVTTPLEARRQFVRQIQEKGMARRSFAHYVTSTCFGNPVFEEFAAGQMGPAMPLVAELERERDTERAKVELLSRECDTERAKVELLVREHDTERAKVGLLEKTVHTLQERLARLEGSRWWRLRLWLLQWQSLLRRKLARGHRRGLLRRLLRVMFAPGQRNLRWAAKTVFKHGYLWLEDEPVIIMLGEANNRLASAGVGTYARWLTQHATRPADLALYREQVPLLRYRPRISILLPVFDPSLDWFRQAVQSVIDQVYPDWELCIADDASTKPGIRQAIAEFAHQEPRIRVVYRMKNGHISAASNSALALASGEYCALLDHDDLLTPDALYHNVLALNGQPELDVLYSDEDKIDAHGLRCDPHFKPQWSPDTLLAGNYVCHLLVARTELIRDIGGFREGFEGAQDFDLVLRLSEQTQGIHHIPRVLYHWRQHEQSTAQTAAAKPYAFLAGQRALQEALERRREPGMVQQDLESPGSYIVQFSLRTEGRTGIVIPTRDQAGLLEACLKSLFERTAYQNFGVLVVDNGSCQPRTFALFQEFASRYPDRFSVLRDASEFNFSRLVNAGVRATGDPFVLLLNNDVEVLATDWLTTMLEQVQRPSIGCVGARLLYPDGSVQHAGVVVGHGELAAHVFRHADGDARGHASRLKLVSNYSAVTGACLLVRRELFEQVGGFDETFAVDYNDVDFCLRVRDAGYHNVMVPQATLWHHELVSRGNSRATEESSRRHFREREQFAARWAKYLASDPCVSPHLVPRGSELRLAA